MKRLALLIMVMLLGLSNMTMAQENEENANDKKSYYEKRGEEDAKYEQSLEMTNEEDEEDFWQDQKQYEKDLKKRDKKAYEAYMQGKKDAYAEHAQHCANHCQHSEHYYTHTHFYYSYHRTYYPRRSGVNTNIRLGSPSIRVGIF